ncbi:hypothetical protein GCM10027035_45220 [Emticicia sediminis]
MSFHTLNRFYLLASLALSLTIPLLSYERTEVVMLEPQPIKDTTFPIESIQENTYSQVPIIQQSANVEESAKVNIDWMQVISTIYLIGVGFMLFLFIKNLLTIFYSIKSASVASSETLPFSVASTSLSHQKQSKKLKILLTESQSNSSFFNYVFLNPDNLNPHEEALIIAHEGFHAQRLHTLDLIILGILKAIFWFNPIVYFYQKSLKQIHEYEVDALMSATYDGREYAHLLLKLGVSPSAMITNQFSTKPLSERIQFLFKTPTKNMKKLSYFLSLPIIVVGVMAFAEEKVVRVYQEKTTKTTQKKPEVVTNEISKIQLDTLKKNTTLDIKENNFTHKVAFPSLVNTKDSLAVYIDKNLASEGKDYLRKVGYVLLHQKFKMVKEIKFVYGFSNPFNPNLFPALTKLNKVEFPDMRFSSKTPVFLAKNENSSLFRYTPFQTRPSTPFSKVAKNQDTLRTILETNKLGKNPLVFINGVEYPSSILYRLNPTIISNSTTYPPSDQQAIEKYGLRAEDGIYILNTQKNKELLLENEKQHRIAIDNIRKQLHAPKKRVQRVVLKDLEGKEYEKVSVMRIDFSSVHFSVDVPVGGKVIFTVDGKSVNEEDIENAKQLYIGGGCGKTHGGKYDAYIDLNTK